MNYTIDFLQNQGFMLTLLHSLMGASGQGTVGYSANNRENGNPLRQQAGASDPLTNIFVVIGERASPGCGRLCPDEKLLKKP